MLTITATELARNTRSILDKVAIGGETMSIERNNALIATIVPATPSMTAAQALAGLPLPMLTAAQGAAWLADSRQSFDDALRDPWE
jgi:antitoxin (DNA-binding transcriptional repressor) of toxin-antitoxin stability system